MSYGKASDLLELALEVSSLRFGMSYAEIDRRSSATSSEAQRRNTQRLVKALERLFPSQFSTTIDELGEKRVHLQGDQLRQLLELKPEELSALDRAIDVLGSSNSLLDADSLKQLRTKIRLLAPAKKRARLEVDYEALLASGHVIVRPGPQPKLEAASMRPLTEALLAMKQVAFEYTGAAGSKRRMVHPYGIISGYRAYLVALVDGASGNQPSLWRIDRMARVEVQEFPSRVPEDFDIRSHARRAFGVFQNPAEHGEVEWRFSPKVAENVLSFRFHPDQEVTQEKDGSVVVRFEASGHLEMAWALYPWGNAVQVIKPEALRKLVEGYQRADFKGVP